MAIIGSVPASFLVLKLGNTPVPLLSLAISPPSYNETSISRTIALIRTILLRIYPGRPVA